MRKKRIFEAAIITLLILVLSACSKGTESRSDSNLVGTWKLRFNRLGVKIEASVDLKEDHTFSLHGNGSGYGKSGKAQVDGVYKVDGNTITFNPLELDAAFNGNAFEAKYAPKDAPSYSASYSVSGDKLILSIDKDGKKWKDISENSPVGIPISSLELSKDS